MAKTKAELLEEAQAAGKVAADVNPDDVSKEQLETMLDPEPTAWQGSLSATEPQVSPDGHVHLSKEDIRNRA